MSNNCSSFITQPRKDGTDFESRKIIILACVVEGAMH